MTNIKNRTAPRFFLFLALTGCLMYSCSKKIEVIKSPDQVLQAENFFKVTKPLSPEANSVYLELKTANERTHFVDKLPKDAGSPIWEKIIISKGRGMKGTVSVNGIGMSSASSSGSLGGDIIIPMEKDNHLSSVMYGRLVDSNAVLTCITNQVLLEKAYDNNTPAPAAEKMVSLFMFVANHVDGTTVFKNIPERLFGNAGLYKYGGKKWMEFKVKTGSKNTSGYSNFLYDYGEEGTLRLCLEWRNSIQCTCTSFMLNNGGCDWASGCTDGMCISSLCFDIPQSGGSSGEPSQDLPIPGSEVWTNNNNGGTALENMSEPPCGGTWFEPEACSDENPGTEAIFEFGNEEIIDIVKFMNCFGQIPDAGATFSVVLNCSVPEPGNPDKLIGKDGHPGHAFLTMTKSGPTGSMTQSFGFYPLVGRKSIAMGAVTNAMKDDGGHLVHGSITMDNISAAQFTTLINTAKSLATMDYDLNDYNCTNYAIAVFNSIRGSGPIAIPNTYGVGTPMRPIINYGQTPNSLFKFISQNAGAYSNLNVTPHQAAASHGECQ